MNLAAEDTASVTRKAEWAFSCCSSHLDILTWPTADFGVHSRNYLCIVGAEDGMCHLLCCPGTAALAGPGGEDSVCTHTNALSFPKLPQAKSNTRSNGLLTELSHKKFNMF